MKMDGLASACKLRRVNFRNNHINDEGLRRLFFYLMHCSFILDIDVSYNNITPLSLRTISDFIGNEVDSVSFVEECEKIQKIDISGVPMDPFNGNKFKKLADAADCDIMITIDYNYNRDADMCKSTLPTLNSFLKCLHTQLKQLRP